MKQQYILRKNKGRNISVEFQFLPGKRISTGTMDEEEAVKFAEAYLRSECQTVQDSITLAEFAKDFFTKDGKGSFKARNLAFGRKYSPDLYLKKQAFLDNYILPSFGDHLIQSINKYQIEDWIISLHGKNVKNLAADTKNKIMICFKEVMEDAVRRQYIQENPVVGIPGMSAGGDIDSPRALNYEEQHMLFPADSAKRIVIFGSDLWALYYSILYDTGFRPAEASGLRVRDVYETAQGLAVYTSHTVNIHREVQERVKTTGKGLESRVGLLDTTTASLMLDYIRAHSLGADDYLFLLDRKNPKSFPGLAGANKHFKACCHKLGIEDVVQYSLRHTFATYRIGGVKGDVLALAMGHSKSVRQDYDNRQATMIINQLEAQRDKLFGIKKDDSVKSLAK